MHANPGVVKLLEERITTVAKAVEDSVDEELHRLENLTQDDLEEVRRKRLEQMKRGAAKRTEWLARGHGVVRDILGEKVRRAARHGGSFTRHLWPMRCSRACRVAQEFFAEMKGEERMVVHFYRGNNWACKVRGARRHGSAPDGTRARVRSACAARRRTAGVHAPVCHAAGRTPCGCARCERCAGTMRSP